MIGISGLAITHWSDHQPLIHPLPSTSFHQDIQVPRCFGLGVSPQVPRPWVSDFMTPWVWWRFWQANRGRLEEHMEGPPKPHETFFFFFLLFSLFFLPGSCLSYDFLRINFTHGNHHQTAILAVFLKFLRSILCKQLQVKQPRSTDTKKLSNKKTNTCEEETEGILPTSVA